MFRSDSRPQSQRSGRPRGFTRPMTDAQADDCIAKWVAILALDPAVPAIRHERISIWQVTGESGRPGCGLVGVYGDDVGCACILHTRRLTEEDIVHELLHVAHPAWSESQVVGETVRLAEIPRTGRGVSQRAPTGRRPASARHKKAAF